MFEDLEDDEFLEDEAYEEQDEGEGEESGNRTFVLAAIFLGAVTIIALLCIGWFLWQQRGSGQNRAAQETEAAELVILNTQEAEMVQMTVDAQSWTPTPTSTPVPTDTPEPTEVVSLPSPTQEEGTGGEPSPEDAATATIAALLTQAAEQPTQDANAIATITVVVTELPDTGLFDDLNVNSMIMLAFFALVVIFLARRMRTANR